MNEDAGRRVARLLVANELLASVLRGGSLAPGRVVGSDAPGDLRVVGADWHDPFAVVVYVQSETFPPVPPGGVIPLVSFTYQTIGGGDEG